jgi:SulP family sulfate permease
MAYAGIAGVPAVYGLYTVPFAMIAYAIFGTSRTLSVGPDSATAIISAAIVGLYVAQGSEEFLVVTATLALVVGLLFLLFGLLRLGWVADFLANPVMKGFMQGLALVVIVGQLPKLFGVEGGEGNFFQELWAIVTQLPEANPATIVVGFASLALLIALKQIIPRAPAALITVILAVLATTIFDLTNYGVEVVGTVETGLPPLGIPDINLEGLASLLPGALAILMVGYAESLGATKTAAASTGEEIDPNQELVALGLSNVGSSISSGFVVAGSLSRTSVVIGSGGRSQFVSLINAALVILTLLFLMPFFKNLPEATLGAIVIHAMTGMLNPSYFRRLYRISRSEFSVSLLTFLSELIFGILLGVLLGVALSLLALIHRASRPGTAIIGRMPDEETYRDITLHPDVLTVPGLLIFRFDNALFFPNAEYFSKEVWRYIRAADVPVQEVMINAETMNVIDTTGADHLIKLHDELRDEGIMLSLAHVKDKVRDMMQAAGAVEVIDPDNIYEDISDGVQAFIKRTEDV